MNFERVEANDEYAKDVLAKYIWMGVVPEALHTPFLQLKKMF